MPYIDSAGVKLPNADLIIEADASGAVTSCRNAVTGEEYAGGGATSISVKFKANDAVMAKSLYVISDGSLVYNTEPISETGGEKEYTVPIFGEDHIIVDLNPTAITSITVGNATQVLSRRISNSIYEYIYKIQDKSQAVTFSLNL